MLLFKNKNVERVISPPKRKVKPKPIIIPKRKPLPEEWNVPAPLINPTPKGKNK